MKLQTKPAAPPPPPLPLPDVLLCLQHWDEGSPVHVQRTQTSPAHSTARHSTADEMQVEIAAEQGGLTPPAPAGAAAAQACLYAATQGGAGLLHCRMHTCCGLLGLIAGGCRALPGRCWVRAGNAECAVLPLVSHADGYVCCQMPAAGSIHASNNGQLLPTRPPM
jgi:hypothetical protein